MINDHLFLLTQNARSQFEQIKLMIIDILENALIFFAPIFVKSMNFLILIESQMQVKHSFIVWWILRRQCNGNHRKKVVHFQEQKETTDT